jgi:site-specific recombinase XerD
MFRMTGRFRDMTLQQAIDTFLEDHVGDSPERRHTRGGYKTSLASFQRHVRDHEEVTDLPTLIQLYVDEGTWSTSASRALYLRVLRGFLRYLYRHRGLAEPPEVKPRLPAIEGEREVNDQHQIDIVSRMFTDQEFRKVLDYCRVYERREFVALQVAYSFGLRLGELLAFGYGQLRYVPTMEQYMFMRYGKGQRLKARFKSDIIEMPSELYCLVRDYMKEQGTWCEGGLLICDSTKKNPLRAGWRYREHVQAIFQKVLHRPIKVHDIRRARISNLLQRGVRSIDVQRICSIGPGEINTYDKRVRMLTKNDIAIMQLA